MSIYSPMLKGLNQVNPDSQGLIWPSSQPNQHRVNMEPQANFLSSISKNTMISMSIYSPALNGLIKLNPVNQGLIWPPNQPSQRRVNTEPQANFISSLSENTIICSSKKRDIYWYITSPSAVAHWINNFTINQHYFSNKILSTAISK